jgi:hypothetical protein
VIDPLRPVAPSERTVEPVDLRRLTPLEREEERRRRERERERRRREAAADERERTPDGRLDIRA